MEVSQGDLGLGTTYKVEFTGGKLVATAAHSSTYVGADLSIRLDTDVVIDAIKAAIPGQVDDMVLELLKQSLKAL